MRKIVLFMMLLCAFQSFGQQDALYSQYMFNPFAINPAYAGTRNSYSMVLLHRSQWVGMPGAPSTQSFAMHAPVTKYGLVWGVNFAHDQIGPSNNIIAAGTAGYQVKFKHSKLNFALRAGFYNSVLNRNLLNFKEDNDQLDVGGKVSAMVPSFDFGVYYYKKKFFVGGAINHLTKHQFNFDGYADSVTTNFTLRRHFILNAGYVWEWKKNFILKPTILFKSVIGAPVNLDVNISALIYKRIWLGISARNTSSIVFMTDINITDFMRVGYAFDLNYSKIGAYTKGSHEIFLGFDFNLKDKQTISPRYL
ncbi:type IX secretion system membrane protein PorP/SprF [Paracrocinitomix mangrovi]|uniref:PorP/SprF family type IX secretion system membrane protein n=1 Tax=Paracrocinitomix mangrovi TaxID=2862509 RepID=UPI001C8DAED6|nr:type IX secretion system membrane protein PorP/SprF [Paracrocinitomix mangrovi]UKN02366.1 type IX secretion system membrane protein PorP/SprF [Paracrocinitomix mangrovi]